MLGAAAKGGEDGLRRRSILPARRWDDMVLDWRRRWRRSRGFDGTRGSLEKMLMERRDGWAAT